MKRVHLIVHTTHYRKGSEQFAVIAQTMFNELSQEHPDDEVILKAILGKKELVAIFNELSSQNKRISSYHFIGHAGMYGPMFGTVEYPEQFSPYELEKLDIPFDEDGEAYFHCCRSARWFAPFFANLHKVTTYGYHNYTAFTKSKKKYQRIGKNQPPMYAIGCAGKKSHGWIGSIKKNIFGIGLEPMSKFEFSDQEQDRTYNKVAHLYDAVFQDIKVREDEWNWISSHLPDKSGLEVLDIGCGNGALLKELAPKIKSGIGLDLSVDLLELAENNNSDHDYISFKQVKGPNLPLPDSSVDLIISMLSFRYLDWDPLMDEIKRVLRPGGRILIVDMVAVPATPMQYPRLLLDKLKQKRQLKKYPEFAKALAELVAHPDWKKMLKYNPIRAEHEMKWYLESRFPGRKMEKINIGFNSSIIAFDSGNIEHIQDIHLTYP
ncbi:class I SAM-dependent methyltransferase [Parvicella tangerina]|uniref:2-methoxy-6-polyprenyl-1,4-benzoquinol methylase, mitochondrial n=1 Tax=Parvicella tangerina TaxID=2829795 RepID=A0A916JLJ7_9FLAO|nr:class I SAM-dependent methyltransferase [Parvicella tangerina]CAG5080406.1 2-methoxy-6-polyprenyl-1,4-benzoquinol methylase, mitochondrial [Parvicella tangerina]